MNDQTTQARRVEALRDLVELRVPIRDATAALGRFVWDSDEELVDLTSMDVMQLLNGYLDGRLSADDCREWAESLEVRDDVGREPGREEELAEFLFEIATPEVAGELTPQRAQQWISRLQQRS
jgi:hypothetical protein